MQTIRATSKTVQGKGEWWKHKRDFEDTVYEGRVYIKQRGRITYEGTVYIKQRGEIETLKTWWRQSVETLEIICRSKPWRGFEDIPRKEKLLGALTQLNHLAAGCLWTAEHAEPNGKDVNRQPQINKEGPDGDPSQRQPPPLRRPRLPDTYFTPKKDDKGWLNLTQYVI